jgi:prevent-host-death family protein
VANWKAAEAKSRFSELIERARADGPQEIWRHGRRVVVVVAAEQWDRQVAKRESLVEFLDRSALAGSGLEIERISGGMREPEL